MTVNRSGAPLTPMDGGVFGKLHHFLKPSGKASRRAQAPAFAELSDETLLLRFAKGDPRAAQLLTDRLGPRAYRIAYRVLGDQAAAEDVAQDAMLKLWRIAPQWDAGRAQVTTWLYRVVMNRAIDIKRRDQRFATAGHDPDGAGAQTAAETADPGPSATEQLQDKSRAAALQWALGQLPERQRQAVILRHIEELSNPQIAEILDLSVEAVESLTARGKRSLAKLLAGQKDELGYHDGR